MTAYGRKLGDSEEGIYPVSRDAVIISGISPDFSQSRRFSHACRIATGRNALEATQEGEEYRPDVKGWGTVSCPDRCIVAVLPPSCLYSF